VSDGDPDPSAAQSCPHGVTQATTASARSRCLRHTEITLKLQLKNDKIDKYIEN
jgi:hypothetical protein